MQRSDNRDRDRDRDRDRSRYERTGRSTSRHHKTVTQTTREDKRSKRNRDRSLSSSPEKYRRRRLSPAVEQYREERNRLQKEVQQLQQLKKEQERAQQAEADRKERELQALRNWKKAQREKSSTVEESPTSKIRSLQNEIDKLQHQVIKPVAQENEASSSQMTVTTDDSGTESIVNHGQAKEAVVRFQTTPCEQLITPPVANVISPPPIPPIRCSESTDDDVVGPPVTPHHQRQGHTINRLPNSTMQAIPSTTTTIDEWDPKNAPAPVPPIRPMGAYRPHIRDQSYHRSSFPDSLPNQRYIGTYPLVYFPSSEIPAQYHHRKASQNWAHETDFTSPGTWRSPFDLRVQFVIPPGTNYNDYNDSASLRSHFHQLNYSSKHKGEIFVNLVPWFAGIRIAVNGGSFYSIRANSIWYNQSQYPGETDMSPGTKVMAVYFRNVLDQFAVFLFTRGMLRGMNCTSAKYYFSPCCIAYMTGRNTYTVLLPR